MELEPPQKLHGAHTGKHNDRTGAKVANTMRGKENKPEYEPDFLLNHLVTDEGFTKLRRPFTAAVAEGVCAGSGVGW